MDVLNKGTGKELMKCIHTRTSLGPRTDILFKLLGIPFQTSNLYTYINMHETRQIMKPLSAPNVCSIRLTLCPLYLAEVHAPTL